MYQGANPATGMNYWVNNTINYPAGGGYGAYMSGTSGYWTLRNNIFKSKRMISIVPSIVGTTPFTFAYNNYGHDVNIPFNYVTAHLSFAQWKTKGFDTLGSFIGDPLLRSSDSALTKKSPGVKAGTPIEGITVSGGVGLPGIDDKAFDPKHPSMGAYAQPVNDDKPTHNPSSIGAYESADPIPKIPQIK
jgi:hypothetical protein